MDPPMRLLFRTAVFCILLIVAGAQVYLPGFVAGRLGDGFREATGIAALDVSVRAFPAVQLLAGRVPRLAVTADDVLVDGLRVEQLQLEAENVRVGMGPLLRGRSPSIRAGGASVRLTVGSEALTEYARGLAGVPADIEVDVDEGGVELKGSVELFGGTIHAAVVGRFEADGDSGLVFVPGDVAVEGQSLPPFMVALLRELYAVHVDLTEGPLPMAVDEVVHEPGKLVVVGRPLLDGLGPAQN